MLALCLLGDAVRDATTEAWSSPGPRQLNKGRSRLGRELSPRAPASRPRPLLSVENLSIGFPSSSVTARVVDNVSFDVNEGEVVGIVGESGCGKTVTTSAVLGLLPGTGRVEEGAIWFFGRDLARLSETELRKIRGREIGLVSQEPTIGLDPAFRVGWQIQEAVRLHLGSAEERSPRPSGPAPGQRPSS